MRALTVLLTLFVYEIVVAADDSPFVFGFEEISPGVWVGVREQRAAIR